MKQIGTVKWYNSEKGYGFITPHNGSKDIFVHSSAVKAAKLNALEDNQKVEYDVEEKQGKTSAINISKIS
ncbi:cold-shock protein [Candidatus Bandiella numerosa]|uniref:cold-shock protein n=1 Tax=Candidatus Bandiella numerosa TaxID=2570586 RepID=UPI001F3D1413|nr:cold-shock protein [Candidatus Bandiella numerosa]